MSERVMGVIWFLFFVPLLAAYVIVRARNATRQLMTIEMEARIAYDRLYGVKHWESFYRGFLAARGHAPR